MRITANSFMPVEAKIIIDGEYYTGEEFNRLVEALRTPSLTDDQQVVLEWLKRKRTVNKFEPLQAIVRMSKATDIYSDSELGRAYYNLTDKEEFQVLAAFANYGLEGNQ